jgi:protein involved in temperature-dependent protein secretion
VRAVEVDPWEADYRGNLARLLAHAGEWDEARVQGEAWLQLDPGSVEARTFRVRCLLRKGADAEWDRIRRLR